MTIDSFVIDQIHAFVNATDQTQDDRIQEYAMQYARACEEVNDRLNKCQLFLLSGHRTQAIRFAEQEPPLKRLVDQLQLHGLVDIWADAVASYGWQRFQPLKAEVLGLIELVYEKEKETSDVLSRYRELSLARAPLSERLLLVRQLAVLDPTNPTWLSDITSLETSLMEDFESQGIEALENGDHNKLSLIIRQHDDQKWDADLPPSYINFLRQAVPIVYKKFSIPEKVRKYQTALTRKDAKEALRLHDEIEEMFARARTYKSDFHVKQSVQEDYEYVNSKLMNFQDSKKMQAFKHDLQILQSVLQGNHTKEQIQSALEQVGRHDIPIPPIVIAEVDACIGILDNSRILTTIAITSLVILVVGLAVLAFLLWKNLN